MKRTRALLCVICYLAVTTIGGRAAEAAFHLEYAEGVQPTKGMSIPRTLLLADVHWPVVQTPPKPRAVKVSPAAHSHAEPSSGRCGGDLPSCSIMACESGGDLTVRNHEGSSATGKWQITRGTWGGYGGYEEARDAPESVQDARARQVWANGAGKGHWRQCL